MVYLLRDIKTKRSTGWAGILYSLSTDVGGENVVGKSFHCQKLE